MYAHIKRKTIAKARGRRKLKGKDKKNETKDTEGEKGSKLLDAKFFATNQHGDN